MKRVWMYMAVFLLTLYCFFLYEDKILVILLAAELLYFPVAMVWLWHLKRKVDVCLCPLLPIAEKNQKIPIKITVQNRSRFLIAHVQISLLVENTFTRQKKQIRKRVTAGTGKTTDVILDLQANSCGNITIFLQKYWIYDLFFLFYRKQKKKESQSIGILPECHLLPVEITRRTREFLAEAEEYSDRESGDDASEIYQIREYRDMDSFRDVHWKLSAKTDELLVKEYGKPAGCVVLIWLNLQEQQKKFKRKNTVLTTILETAASLSMSLLEEECVHMVAWYERENKKIQKKRVHKEEHIYELLNRLLYIKSYQENIEEEYQEAFRGTAFSSVVELRMDGSVWVNGEVKEESYFIL